MLRARLCITSQDGRCGAEEALDYILSLSRGESVIAPDMASRIVMFSLSLGMDVRLVLATKLVWQTRSGRGFEEHHRMAAVSGRDTF